MGVLILLGLAALAVIASELLLPAYLEGRIEDRLTIHGGRATASLEARPAVRLLAGDGKRVTIVGSGIRLELVARDSADQAPLFERLDGFDQVSVRLVDFRAGPFKTRRLALTRAAGSDRYRLGVEAATSGQALVEYAASSLAGPLAGLAARLSPLRGDGRVPIRMDLELRSDGGQAEIVSGGSTVAGVPTGVLGQALIGAVLARI